MDFYPLILEMILRNALKFAKRYAAIYTNTTDIIMHCRKSSLICHGNLCIKKQFNL